jgi:heat shock protein HtpX
MYFVDLFKRIFRKANAPVMLYLVLNVCIIGLITHYLAANPIGTALEFPLWAPFQIPVWAALGLGVVIYGLSLIVALSPVGEWVLRLQSGCRKIKRVEQRGFLEPLFHEVLQKARMKHPALPNDVRLFINSDGAPNAFAIGRKTICITEGMLNLPKDQIMAALAHECGHLVNHDTDLILLVAVGNVVVSGILLAIRCALNFLRFVLSVVSAVLSPAKYLGFGIGFVVSLFQLVITVATYIHNILCNYVLTGLTWLWTALGILLVIKSGKAKEFDADKCAYDLGYGDSLCQLLDQEICTEKAKGLFANLANGHPDKNERIAKLQALGASYRVSYGAAE